MTVKTAGKIENLEDPSLEDIIDLAQKTVNNVVPGSPGHIIDLLVKSTVALKTECSVPSKTNYAMIRAICIVLQGGLERFLSADLTDIMFPPKK